jgi:osmoprotectant transport system substrate-binding protein
VNLFKKSKLFKGILLILLLAFTLSIVGGCSEESKTIKVGSKEFTEQLILGQITILALENAGFKVVDKTNVAGSDKVRQALEQGDIDLYWEYTGTAWLVHLQHDNALTDSEEAYQKVKEEDSENGMVWLDYAPLNNTYTLMMRKDDMQSLGIKSLSDLASYVNAHPNEFTFAGDHEFSVRPDGLQGVEELYGFKFPEKNIKTIELGITYKALKEKEADVAMGFATDARIAAYNLANLEDDKNFFPVYNPAPVVRQEVFDKYPEIADILNPIAERLDTETMTQLNYQVDIEEKEPDEVAEEWLRNEGFID